MATITYWMIIYIYYDNIYIYIIYSYIICLSVGQSCFLVSSVIFSVLNNDPGGSYCGLATFRAHFFCHNSVNSTLRASVLRSAKKFCLKGMCNHLADYADYFQS